MSGQRIASGVQFDCDLAAAVDLVDNSRAAPTDATGSAALANYRKVARGALEALEWEARRERLRDA